MFSPAILGHPFLFANSVLSTYDKPGYELDATKTQGRARNVLSIQENRTGINLKFLNELHI